MSDDLIIDLSGSFGKPVEAMASVNRAVTQLGEAEEDPAETLARIAQRLGDIKHDLMLLTVQLRRRAE
jgi:hypothetical protein